MGIPILQFGLVYKLWSQVVTAIFSKCGDPCLQFGVRVNREECQNSCWDTNFKAGYETGIGSYKHVYFNTTWQAAVIWLVTVIAILSLYEAVRYLVRNCKP